MIPSNDAEIKTPQVFEKNSFIFEKSVPEAIKLQESKTGVKGKKAGLCLMRWERKES